MVLFIQQKKCFFHFSLPFYTFAAQNPDF